MQTYLCLIFRTFKIPNFIIVAKLNWFTVTLLCLPQPFKFSQYFINLIIKILLNLLYVHHNLGQQASDDKINLLIFIY